MTRQTSPDVAIQPEAGAEGEFHGSIDRSSWELPFHVRAEDGYLVFDYIGGDGGRGFATQSGARYLLGRFAGLGWAGDRKIAQFAKDHGALGLCGHGEPKHHRVDPPYNHCAEPSDGPEWDSELIETWRDYADVMAFILRLAGQFPDQPNLRDRLFLETLHGLIERSATRPRLKWDGRVFRVTLGNGTLLGALIVQLIYVVAGGGLGMVGCHGCGSWFTPARAPSPGRHSWCEQDECQKRSRSVASAQYRRLDRDNPARIKLPRGRRVQAHPD